MDKRELEERVSKITKLNRTIHSPNGATAENIKKLNYLIIETLSQGATCKDVLREIASGSVLQIIATKSTYDLLCRVVEQASYPTLVYNPEVTYTEDLRCIPNCAFDESRVKGSQWYKNFTGIYGITEEERYRFTQCYMLIEQFGREEYVIDKTVSTVLGFKHDRYFAKGMIGKSYHDKSIEVAPKLEIIRKLAFCPYADYATLEQIVSMAQCDSPAEYELLMSAYQSGVKMASSNSYFKSTNSMGVKGDGGVYPLQRFKNGIPYDVDKYEEAYSMANATNLAMGKIGEFKSHLDRVANTIDYTDDDTSDMGDL